MKKIELVLLDFDGFEMSRDEYEFVKDAKERGKYMLSEAYAKICESTHQNMRTHKVEVRVNGECVWDEFYKSAKPVVASVNAEMRKASGGML